MKNNIIEFPNKNQIDKRKNFQFKTKSIEIIDEEGNKTFFPCICLFEKQTNILVWITGYERYIKNLYKLSRSTREKRAKEICHFLNYWLHETTINHINECDIDVIAEYLKYSKRKNTESDVKVNTWETRRNTVLFFLRDYYKSNKDGMMFKYSSDQIGEFRLVRDKRNKKIEYLDLSDDLDVKPPCKNNNSKKNRYIAYHHFYLLVNEAKKYDPELVLGLDLQAYAGIRAGGIVNLTYGSINIPLDGFGDYKKIKLDLFKESLALKNRDLKTEPGSIKKNRFQEVYTRFIEEVYEALEEHRNRAIAKGYDISPEAPLFRDSNGNPMTVSTYRRRVRKLFYERFLPTLEKNCEVQGDFAENIAYIEQYREEYPGAHMFRHWFTNYLSEKAKLRPEMIKKWRGDSSLEAMLDYLSINEDMRADFNQANFIFQEAMKSVIKMEDK